MYALQIQTGELRETDLPPGYGEWSDYAKFAVTFAPRDRESCTESASGAFARWRRTGEVPRTLEELLVRAAPLALPRPRARHRRHALRGRAHPRDAHALQLEPGGKHRLGHRVVHRRHR